MKTSEYLYGTSADAWASLEYKKALKKRVMLARKLLDRLTEEDLHNKDFYRIKEVTEAIEFNETLLKELK